VIALLDGDQRLNGWSRGLDDRDLHRLEQPKPFQPAAAFLERRHLEDLARQVRELPPNDRIVDGDVPADVDSPEHGLQAGLGVDVDPDAVGRHVRLQDVDPRVRVAGVPECGHCLPRRLLHVGSGERLSRLERGAGSEGIHPPGRQDPESGEGHILHANRIPFFHDDAERHLIGTARHDDAVGACVRVAALGVEGFNALQVGVEDRAVEIRAVAPGEPRVPARLEERAEL